MDLTPSAPEPLLLSPLCLWIINTLSTHQLPYLEHQLTVVVACIRKLSLACKPRPFSVSSVRVVNTITYFVHFENHCSYTQTITAT